jgi:hypothetical protein
MPCSCQHATVVAHLVLAVQVHANDTTYKQYVYLLPACIYIYTLLKLYIAASSKSTNRTMLSCLLFCALLLHMSGRSALADIGVRRYVSKAALAEIIAELKQLDELPTAASRQTLARARTKTVRVHTNYGELFVSMELELDTVKLTKYMLKKKNGGSKFPRRLELLSPMAMLSHASTTSQPFNEFLTNIMAANPSSHTHPWSIIIYSDEITPGNVIAHENLRKTQTIYWTFKQFGIACLSCEELWFTLTLIRSALVKCIPGGMSRVMADVTSYFFGAIAGNDMRYGGITIRGSDDKLYTIFADIDIHVSDESALKHALAVKGASGALCCGICRNVVNKLSGASRSQAGFVVQMHCTDKSKFLQHTDESILANATFLQEQQPLMTKGRFEKLQTALGMNYSPNGLILRRCVKPISTLMYDWFHIFLVHGLFQLVLGKMLDFMKKLCKIDAVAELDVFVRDFNFPAKVQGVSGQRIFANVTKDKKTHAYQLKCQGSEALSIYNIVRVWVLHKLMSISVVAVRRACACFLLLCSVLDLLIKVRTCAVTPGELDQAVTEFVDTFVLTFGVSMFIPKGHLAMHLGDMLRKFGMLVSCFVHERKHKSIKRLLNTLRNTSSGFETSILEDVVLHQMYNLRLPYMLPNTETHLVDPHAAPKTLTATVRAIFGAVDVLTASSVSVSMNRIGKNDVIVAQCGGSDVVAKVLWHMQVANTCWSCITPWPSTGVDSFYHMQNEPVLIPSSKIRDACVYKTEGDVAYVLLP